LSLLTPPNSIVGDQFFEIVLGQGSDVGATLAALQTDRKGERRVGLSQKFNF
jgi:hypothetical protein